MVRMRLAWLVPLVCGLSAPVLHAQDHGTERIRLATYNIEHFNARFDQLNMPDRSRSREALWADEEDLYEIAATIGLADFDADVIAIQECTEQKNLELFNQRWLKGRYGFVKVFPGNTEGQWIGILVKPGFEVLEVRENDYLQMHAGQPVFPRGPGWVKLRSPGGNVMWVGSTHVKSKSGNNAEMTRQRALEIAKHREIIGLLHADKTPVLLGGDFNDDFGLDGPERQVGLDAIAQLLAGPPEGLRIRCVTRERLPASTQTFHGELKGGAFRAFIDHWFVTEDLEPAVKRAWYISDPIAKVASDHLPVLIELELPVIRAIAPATQPANAPGSGASSNRPGNAPPAHAPAHSRRQPAPTVERTLAVDSTDLAALARAESLQPEHNRKLYAVEGTLQAGVVSPSGKIAMASFLEAPQADAFQIVWFSPVFPAMQQMWGDASAAALAGKRVRVVGPLNVYNSRPQIIIARPDQISVLP